MVFLQAHGASPALATRIVRRYGAARDEHRLARALPPRARRQRRRLQDGRPHRGRPSASRPTRRSGCRPASSRSCTTSPKRGTSGPRSATSTALAAHDARARRRRRGRARAHRSRARRVRPACGRVVARADRRRAASCSPPRCTRPRCASRRGCAELAPARPEAARGASPRPSRASRRSARRRARARAAARRRRGGAARRCSSSPAGPASARRRSSARSSRCSRAPGVVVRLAAPTGRAAKRLERGDRRRGDDAPPPARVRSEDGDASSATGTARSRPAPSSSTRRRCSICPSADALAQAVAPGTRLVLVGDVDQLPWVGPGRGAARRHRLRRRPVRAPARDLPPGRAEPHRHQRPPHQRRRAARAPRRAGAGRATSSSSSAAIPSARATTRRSSSSTSRIPERFGLDPVRDIQVLTPMHRGPAGAIALNEALQAALNPRGAALVRGARTYRVGDKVMQLRNDYDRDVFNGDVGLVASIDPEEGAHDRALRRARRRLRGASTSTTSPSPTPARVHKSQGSEYPAVVIPLLTAHFVMLTQEPPLHGGHARQAPRRPGRRSAGARARALADGNAATTGQAGVTEASGRHRPAPRAWRTGLLDRLTSRSSWPGCGQRHAEDRMLRRLILGLVLGLIVGGGLAAGLVRLGAAIVRSPAGAGARVPRRRHRRRPHGLHRRKAHLGLRTRRSRAGSRRSSAR